MGENGRWDEAYVTAAGLRLRVGRRGDGRPLLLITGIGAHLDMWAPFARARRRPRADRVRSPPAPGSRSGRGCRCGCGASPASCAELLDALAARAGRRARLLVRRRARAGARPARARSRPPARAVRDGAGPRRAPAAADGRPDAGHAGALLPPAAARAQRRRTSRADARRASPRCSPSTPASGCARPPDAARLRLPAVRGGRAGRACHGCTACRQPTLVVAGEDDPERAAAQRPPARRAPARRVACTWSRAAGTSSCSTSRRASRPRSGRSSTRPDRGAAQCVGSQSPPRRFGSRDGMTRAPAARESHVHDDGTRQERR